MTGQAYTMNAVAHGLAVLPMATPDSDFMACYDRMAENLTKPHHTLGIPAALVLQGYRAGRVSDDSLAKVSASRSGITHTSALASSLLDDLVATAVQDARAFIEQSGMTQPDDSMIDMFASVDSYSDGASLRLEVSLGSNCRIADIDAFMSTDLPDDLRELANVALYRMSVIAPLCSYIPVLMEEDDFAIMGLIHAECPEFVDLAEEWVMNGVPEWDEAVAQVTDCAAEDEAAEAIEALERIWGRLHWKLSDEHPELASLPTNEKVLELASAAEAAGHDHALIRYARGVVSLDRALTESLEQYQDALNFEADMNYLMFMVTTTGAEWGYATDQAEMTMQSGETPGICIDDITETPWDALRALLASYYTQALAFEALLVHGLYSHHKDTDDV